MTETILKVKMLGGFSMQYGGNEIVLDRNYASKSVQLLQMVLLCTEEGAAKSSLIDALYGREDVENKNGSFNNTIFRLRKQLKTAGLPDGSYISIQNGLCQWDGRVPVEIDCCEFEKKVKQAKAINDDNLRAELLLEACRLYTAEFLPLMIGEDWVAVKNTYYRKLYFEVLEKVCQWLKNMERFEDVYELTTAASDIYPFEDWQLWRIDSLIAIAKYKEAMEVYEKTTRLYFDELGLPPSPEMLKRFRFMAERLQQSSGAIEDIKQRLEEKEMNDGAYYCSFPSFVDIYHVVSRMMERNGTSVYVMLCTLRENGQQILGNNDKDKDASQCLQESIRTSLRRGDFYTRYNVAQYLIMLSGITQENCKIVSERIDAVFKKNMKRKEYQVDYYVASVADICPGLAKETMQIKQVSDIWKLREES